MFSMQVDCFYVIRHPGGERLWQEGGREQLKTNKKQTNNRNMPLVHFLSSSSRRRGTRMESKQKKEITKYGGKNIKIKKVKKKTNKHNKRECGGRSNMGLQEGRGGATLW